MQSVYHPQSEPADFWFSEYPEQRLFSKHMVHAEFLNILIIV